MKRAKSVSALIVLAFALASFSGFMYARTESAPAQTGPQDENIDRVAYWEEHPEESPYEFLSNARYLAVVAESVAPGGGLTAQESVMWCVLNRVDAVGFPDTIAGVCTQPYQWQGYDESVQYSSDTYTLAREVLQRWYDGESGNIPMGSVFMEVTPHGLKYRRLFTESESVKVYFDKYSM